MRLVRDNDDPKLVDDIGRLVARFGRPDGRAAGGGGGGGGLPDIADPFVRAFVVASVHVRRYLPFYLGGAAWVVVMLVAGPITSGDADRVAQPAASTGADVRPAAPAGVSTAGDGAPSIGAPDAGTADFVASPLPPAAFDDEDADDAAAAPVFFPPSFASPTFAGGSDAGDSSEPEPLMIVRSGYSSRTAGTPLEQSPPDNGLPVGAVGGNPTKRSFVALQGTDTLLRLRLVDHPTNVNVEAAVVHACEIVVDGWKSERGQSFDAEPSWNQLGCATGAAGSDGVWTFDLSAFGAPGERTGFALTTLATDGPVTFNLTFAPAAVAS